MLKFKVYRINKQKGMLYGSLLSLLTLGLLAGYFAGYYEAVGTYPRIPMIAVEELPMPPEILTTQQTFEDVSDFIADDIVDKEPFEEGMNCVDYALIVARNAHWKGLGAQVVKLEFEAGFDHAMLIFPTSDQGYIFMEPQTDKVFDVMRVGDTYDARLITSVDVLSFYWIPIEEYLGGKNNE